MRSKPTNSDQRRVVVYVDPKLHDALKAKLRARGQSVSWWFSKKATDEVSKK